jgi:hypothetical protein
MTEEIWKDVPGYEGLYQVSNNGNVRSFIKSTKTPGCPHLLKPNYLVGYRKVGLYKNKKRRNCKVSVLVAISFLGHKPDGYTKVVDHINGIRDDDRLSNLQVITHRENITRARFGKNKYTGVTRLKKAKKNPFLAAIVIDSKRVHLGVFPTEELAAEAYIKRLNEFNKLKTTL